MYILQYKFNKKYLFFIKYIIAIKHLLLHLLIGQNNAAVGITQNHVIFLYYLIRWEINLFKGNKRKDFF